MMQLPEPCSVVGTECKHGGKVDIALESYVRLSLNTDGLRKGFYHLDCYNAEQGYWQGYGDGYEEMII